MLCSSLVHVLSKLAKTSDSDSILQLENRSPSNLYIYIHLYNFSSTEVEQINRVVTFKGEFQFCPLSRFLKEWWDLVGQPGCKYSRMLQRKPRLITFLDYSPSTTHEGTVPIWLSFACFTKRVDGCMCECMYSNRECVVETNCKNSASE